MPVTIDAALAALAVADDAYSLSLSRYYSSPTKDDDEWGAVQSVRCEREDAREAFGAACEYYAGTLSVVWPCN